MKLKMINNYRLIILLSLITIAGTTYWYNITMPLLMTLAIAYLTKGWRKSKKPNQ